MARIIRPTTRPCIPRFVGIREWKGLSMGRVRMKKKRSYATDACAFEWLRRMPRKIESVALIFFFYSDGRGWIRWLRMDNLEERVEARVDKSRDERVRTCNVYCICLLLLIGLTIFLSFLISISVKIRTCNFLHSSSCTWHESLNTIDPLDLYLTGFRDNV